MTMHLQEMAAKLKKVEETDKREQEIFNLQKESIMREREIFDLQKEVIAIEKKNLEATNRNLLLSKWGIISQYLAVIISILALVLSLKS